MARFVLKRISLMMGMFVVLNLDHDLFMPFGLFLATGFFFVFSWLLRKEHLSKKEPPPEFLLFVSLSIAVFFVASYLIAGMLGYRLPALDRIKIFAVLAGGFFVMSIIDVRNGKHMMDA